MAITLEVMFRGWPKRILVYLGSRRSKIPAFVAITLVGCLTVFGMNAVSKDERNVEHTTNPFAGTMNDGSSVSKSPADSTRTIPSATGPQHPEGPEGKWTLAFSDDFEGNEIDLSKWTTCYPYGSEGCTNTGNHELEWYQPGNVSVADDQLNLQARKESVKGLAGRTYSYTSGMVTTGPEATNPSSAPRYQFQYGYVEARVKVPAGKGLWPAVWMLPADLQWPPEIDILEILGHDTDTVHLNNHWGSANNPQTNNAEANGPDFSAGYHTFGIDWKADSITWYIDGKVANHFDSPGEIPHEKMFLLMNLAVGGDWPGHPNPATRFPSTMAVDWVRVWNQA